MLRIISRIVWFVWWIVWWVWWRNTFVQSMVLWFTRSLCIYIFGAVC